MQKNPKQMKRHFIHDKITYDKINKDLTQIKQRIRSQIELLFPEFTDVVKLDTETALYLLSSVITPEDCNKINLFLETLRQIFWKKILI